MISFFPLQRIRIRLWDRFSQQPQPPFTRDEFPSDTLPFGFVREACSHLFFYYYFLFFYFCSLIPYVTG